VTGVQDAVLDHVLDHDGPWTEAAYLALAANGLARGDGRAELVDGALIIGPGVTGERAGVVERMRDALSAALPDGLRVLGPVALRLGPDCVLVPDLVVARAVDTAAGDAAAADTPAADTPAADTPAADTPAADTPAADTQAGVAQAADAEVDAPAAGPPAVEAGAAGVDPAGPEVLDAADVLMIVEVVGREHGAAHRLFKPQIYARSRIPYSVLIDRHAPFAVADMIISGRYHEYARATDDNVLTLEEPFPLTVTLGGE
jgi:hypothetical protein